ncbi:MAG TPA: hypothetical protein VFO41_11820, partial [Alphaproteobacteria bacterium]|nr:hypothetical protein [Alphaproteobacteria bacterium]
MVAAVIHALLAGVRRFESEEERLVIAAIRRASPALQEASLDRIADHISGMDAAAAQGFFNNVRGVYNELLFVHLENTDGDGVAARLQEATSHPGSDVVLTAGDGTVTEVQLKATDSAGHVREHLQRYPDIEVLATAEVAGQVDGVGTTGIANAALKADIADTVGDLPGMAPVKDVAEAALSIGGSSALAAAAIQAGMLLKTGHTARRDLNRTLGDVAVSAGTIGV